MMPTLAAFHCQTRDNLAAAHKPALQSFILFERFQIALPLDVIGIILVGTGIDPVGAGQIPKK
jgi:hypothetical protein